MHIMIQFKSGLRNKSEMNTNPLAKTILCYGDSNTWGRMPDRTGRFDAETRWTGQLQKLLGDEYYIIEEGLGGRTTDLDDPDHVKNGLTYLIPCLKSHEPIDIVILMLGTNDFKSRFKRNADDVANALSRLLRAIRDVTDAKIIILCPAPINTHAPRFMEFYADHFELDADEKSEALYQALELVARKENSLYINVGDIATYGDDGLHLTAESHTKLANTINNLFNSENF